MRLIPMKMAVSSGWSFRTHFGYCVHHHHSVVRSCRSFANGGRGLAQVPPRENHGLVDDYWALCPHRLPLHPCRVSALLRLGTGQQKCDAPRQRIRRVVCRLRPRRYVGELRRTPHSQWSLCRSHERGAAGRLRCRCKLCLRGVGIPHRGLLRHRRPFDRNFHHRFRDVEGERNFQEDPGLFGPGRRRVWIHFSGRFFMAVMLHTVLITIWFLFVGYRLCRLGWDHADLNLAPRGASQAVDCTSTHAQSPTSIADHLTIWSMTGDSLKSRAEAATRVIRLSGSAVSTVRAQRLLSHQSCNSSGAPAALLWWAPLRWLNTMG
jgi:hypothetical protein